MSNRFDLSPYSFNFQPGTYPPPAIYFPESSAQTDWVMGISVSANVDPYLRGFSRSVSADSGEVNGNWNETNLSPRTGNCAGCYIEQCSAEDCFFDCKSHGIHRETEPHREDRSRKTFDMENENYCGSDGFPFSNFIAPKDSSAAAGEHESWPDPTSAPDSLSHVFPDTLSHGIGYHSRCASVPSSPTEIGPHRQRRMSEPFNSIINRRVRTGVTMQSTRSTGSLLHFNGPGSSRDPKPILFKTELCRGWEEKGACRYGNKCQFAHSLGELRPVPRHPKYKTQLCKTFLEIGSCNYGSRCCFLHSASSPERQVAKGTDMHLDIFP